MDDQRVIGRTSLGGIDLFGSLGVGSVTAKTVNRLGREDNKPARLKDARRLG